MNYFMYYYELSSVHGFLATYHFFSNSVMYYNCSVKLAVEYAGAWPLT